MNARRVALIAGCVSRRVSVVSIAEASIAVAIAKSPQANRVRKVRIVDLTGGWRPTIIPLRSVRGYELFGGVLRPGADLFDLRVGQRRVVMHPGVGRERHALAANLLADAVDQLRAFFRRVVPVA